MKISTENATAQLDTMLSHYDIVIEEMSDDLRKSITVSLKKIRKAIEDGWIEIKVDGEGDLLVEQTLSKPGKGGASVIKYREVDGRAKIAMKDNSSDDYHGKLYSFLGGLSGQGSAAIMRLQGRDLAIAEALGMVFLQL